MLLNQNELSKKLNLSKSRISQLKKEGRLNHAMARDPISNQLKFDYKKVLEVLSKSDPDYNSKSLETKLPLNNEPKKSLETKLSLNSNEIETEEPEETETNIFKIDNKESYEQARTRKMQFSAELERLEVEELSGRLVDGNKVKKDFYEIGKRIKESLFNLPDRLASQFVAMNDRNEIYFLLREEIELALRELSNDEYK
ncbi:hypothetical protein [Silvanigrella sp.]|jgi:hypothetical protein|uniref:hypothetical protein n=1 Tax=Silvanigrella sp. TaxID=2024976 RepID=UPI0037C51DA0